VGEVCHNPLILLNPAIHLPQPPQQPLQPLPIPLNLLHEIPLHLLILPLQSPLHPRHQPNKLLGPLIKLLNLIETPPQPGGQVIDDLLGRGEEFGSVGTVGGLAHGAHADVGVAVLVGTVRLEGQVVLVAC